MHCGKIIVVEMTLAILLCVKVISTLKMCVKGIGDFNPPLGSLCCSCSIVDQLANLN